MRPSVWVRKGRGQRQGAGNVQQAAIGDGAGDCAATSGADQFAGTAATHAATHAQTKPFRARIRTTNANSETAILSEIRALLPDRGTILPARDSSRGGAPSFRTFANEVCYAHTHDVVPRGRDRCGIHRMRTTGGLVASRQRTLGTAQENSIEFSGTGRWYQFRTGACGESAVVAVRRQQLHSHDQLRHSRGARGWSNEHELKVSES